MLYILIFTVLYGLIPFLLIITKIRSKSLIPILPFSLVMFISSLYEYVGSILLEINVENWFIFYGLIAFASIHYYFYRLLNENFRILFILTGVIFFALYTYSIVIKFPIDFFVANSFFKVYQTIIVLLFSIIWFRKTFQELEIENLLHCSAFYFVSGLLIYYSGTVFLFLSASNIFNSNQDSFQYYWLINIILTFVLRSSLIVGIWKARQE